MITASKKELEYLEESPEDFVNFFNNSDHVS